MSALESTVKSPGVLESTWNDSEESCLDSSVDDSSDYETASVHAFEVDEHDSDVADEKEHENIDFIPLRRVQYFFTSLQK